MELARKLVFVLMRYRGRSISSISTSLRVSRQTGYVWQRGWNDRGFDWLVHGRSTGRRPRLSEEQLSSFADMVSEGSMTTSQARDLLMRMFGVTFTEKHIAEILRSQGLRLAIIYEIDDLPLHSNHLYDSNNPRRWTR